MEADRGSDAPATPLRPPVAGQDVAAVKQQQQQQAQPWGPTSRSLAARRSAAATQPPSGGCPAAGQRDALCLFFLATGGPGSATPPPQAYPSAQMEPAVPATGWVHTDGWLTGCAGNFTQRPAATGTCVLLLSGGGGNVTMPDHCCWFGVACCIANTSACDQPMDDRFVCLCASGFGSVVSISLLANNVVGPILWAQDGSSFWLQQIGCSLQVLELQDNSLNSTLPNEISLLSNLRVLSLGYNFLTGTIPEAITALTALEILELTANSLYGPVPRGLCESPGLISDSLTDLLVANNALTGVLDFTYCRSLITLDVTNNKLHDVVANLTLYRSLRQLLLGGNLLINFFGVDDSALMDSSDGRLGVTGTSIRNVMPSTHFVSTLDLSHNRMGGALTESMSFHYYLTVLNLANNAFTSTLPANTFEAMGSLTSVVLYNNRLTGTVPETLGKSDALTYLDLSSNGLTGTLPDSVVESMSSADSYLDVRDTYLSCCGSNFTTMGLGGGFYQSINWSAPRLPKGLAFSPLLRPVVDQRSSQLLNSTTTLSCPYVVRVSAASQDASSQSSAWPIEEDAAGVLLLNWFFNPAYTMYHNCTCDAGSTMVNDTLGQNVYCIPNSPAGTDNTIDWYIWLIIAVSIALALASLVLRLLYLRGMRPLFWNALLNVRKRLKGAPRGGRVSIVVTDIQGFTDLMKHSPGLMTKALHAHNHLIRKAMWTNFGTVVEQEGDSFSIVFHEAADAVKFCLQAQLLLAKEEWPEGLFSALPSGPSLLGKERRSKAGTLSTLWRSRTHFRSKAASSGLIVDPDPSMASAASKAPRAPSLLNGSEAARAPSKPALVSAASQRVSPSASAPALPSSVVPGLRVRMGVASGEVPSFAGTAGSAVMQLTKEISDAGCGGQVLLCDATFDAVRTITKELGCVDVNGVNYIKLHKDSPYNASLALSAIIRLWRRYATKSAGPLAARPATEALLLHMGQYLWNGKAARLPAVLTPQHLQSGRDTAEQPQQQTPELPAVVAANGCHSDEHEGPKAPSHAGLVLLTRAPSQPQASGPSPPPCEGLRLFQVLAPELIPRGRLFGSALALKQEWAALDPPYFSAPGAMSAPLSSSDAGASSPVESPQLPPVTVVFCMAEGGKQYAAKNRKDAKDVHAELLALLYSVLRQVPGSYFVKGQDGDLKYMLAFGDPKGALLWCLAVQECALHVDWPASALRHWPEERGPSNELLFRGPRLKMGVCEGSPRSIEPDHNGRADYFGDSVNQAARFMDAAAHGGQVACQEELVQRIVESLSAAAPAAADNPLRSSPAFPTLHPSSTPPPRLELELSSGAGGGGGAAAGAGPPANGRQSAALQRHDGMFAGSSSATSLRLTPCLSGIGEASPNGQAAATAPAAGPEGPLPSPLGRRRSVVRAPSRACAASKLPVLGSPTEVMAVRLGKFKFKGSDEVISMLHVTQASLAGRSFPSEPPKGKGGRVAADAGVAASTRVRLLDIVSAYSSERGSGQQEEALVSPNGSTSRPGWRLASFQ